MRRTNNIVKYYGKKIEDDDKKIAIIISSTSKYKFIWNTFFHLLRLNWIDCPYQIYFTSDGDCEYLKDKYNINIFKQEKDLGFLEGYRYICNKIKNNYEYFILLQDDFLIEKKVKQDILNKYQNIIENNDIGFIRIMPCPGPKGNKKRFGDIEIGKINNNENFLFSYQTSLWDINFFLELTNNCNRLTPWKSEIYLCGKLKKYKKENWGFIRPFKNWDAVYESPIPYRPTAIVKGKLTDWAKKLIIS